MRSRELDSGERFDDGAPVGARGILDPPRDDPRQHPDERLGETLAAVIMPKPGAEFDADGVRAHVAAHLARFKVPEHVWLQREPLPRLPSGKIYKRALREQALSALRDAEDD